MGAYDRAHSRTKGEKINCIKFLGVFNLKKKFPRKPTPAARTVRREKQRMGYRRWKVIQKPQLNKALMLKRYNWAIKHQHIDLSTTVVIDEKWFTKEKLHNKEIEARPCSPPGKERFQPKQAETNTQLIKLMFITAVTADHKILNEELDCKKFHETQEVDKVGVTALMLKPVFKRIAKTAQKALPGKKLSIMLDRARPHTAQVSQDLLLTLFPGGVIYQEAKNPDTNNLDAALFPLLERQANAECAVDKKDIRRVVNKIWRSLTPTNLQRVAARVRRNIQKIIELKGGNFYCG